MISEKKVLATGEAINLICVGFIGVRFEEWVGGRGQKTR